jgi:integrase
MDFDPTNDPMHRWQMVLSQENVWPDEPFDTDSVEWDLTRGDDASGMVTGRALVVASPWSFAPVPRSDGRGSRKRGKQQSLLAGVNFDGAGTAYAQLPTLRPNSKAARKRYKGPIKRANVLDAPSVSRVLEYIASESHSPESDLLKFLLSLRGGLRAGEISHLAIAKMLDANGRIADQFEIYASKTKKRRMLEMHPEIHMALERLLRRYPHATHVAFSVGQHGQLRRQSASAVTNFFHRLYQKVGLIGCSSHSGRRTFATQVARLLGQHGSSLKDLQRALGHACLSSTECYLEPTDQFAQLIRSLGS